LNPKIVRNHHIPFSRILRQTEDNVGGWEEVRVWQASRNRKYVARRFVSRRVLYRYPRDNASVPSPLLPTSRKHAGQSWTVFILSATFLPFRPKAVRLITLSLAFHHRPYTYTHGISLLRAQIHSCRKCAKL
jgi:hypothetical protein